MAEPREWWVRLRYRSNADRILRHQTVETHVMGRGAVLWLAAWMVPAAIVQASTQDSSKLLADLGGTVLSVAWATVLLAGVVLVWVSRFMRVPMLRVQIEGIGTVLLALAIIASAASLLSEAGWQGSLFVVTLCWTSSTNLLARAFMLARQLLAAWQLRKVAKDAT